jgi:hypothetical protein
MRALPYVAATMTASILLGCDDHTDTASLTTPSVAAPARASFLTSGPAQARALGSATVKPIISVGDPIPGLEDKQDRYERVWAPIPDGLGAYEDSGDLVVLANHEITSGGVDGHFPYARVSRLVLDEQSLEVKEGSYAITGRPAGSLGLLFQRLCSATLIGRDEGFGDGWFLTGEESFSSGAEGIQLAVRQDGSHVRRLPWLGRFAHENYIAVPGFRNTTVMLGTDDTSPAGLGEPLASELYMYVADNPGGVLNGTGRLYVFKSSQAKNVGDLDEGESVWGRFEQLPDASSLSADELQEKADRHGAFKFVRLEDLDYDRRATVGQGPRSGDPLVYFVDTGNADGLCGSEPCDLNGSIYSIRLNADAPTRAAKLTLLARSSGAGQEWASPDNIALSEHSLMVQEDPAYAGFTRPERIWNFPLKQGGGLGNPRAVVELRTERLSGTSCSEPDGTCWESSGIIDVSRYLGEGSWLFDVQAHTLPFAFQDGDRKVDVAREGGQLLYLQVDGS